MKTQFSMQKVKRFATQLTWEFIGSVFIAAGIYKIFRDFNYLISAAECSDWTFHDCTKYPAGDYLLPTSRKKILCQFSAMYVDFFFDD